MAMAAVSGDVGGLLYATVCYHVILFTTIFYDMLLSVTIYHNMVLIL